MQLPTIGLRQLQKKPWFGYLKIKKMKNLVTILFVFGIFCLSNAQEIKTKKGENYLPEAGDWAISFNANGVFKYLGNAFNGKLDNEAPSVSSTVNNSFVGKKFITDKSAYRVLANVGYNTLKGIEPRNNINEIDEIQQSSLIVDLGFGKEWRKGKTRLQGLYGVDALLSIDSSTIKAIRKNVISADIIGIYDAKQGIGFGAAIQGFIGAEYFIFPKFAIGP